jgi:hypothetical protein
LFDKCNTSLGLLSQALKVGGYYSVVINGVERNFNFKKPGVLSNLRNAAACRGVEEKSLSLPALYKYTHADCILLPGKEVGLTGVYFVPKTGESEKYVILGIWVAACGDVHYVIMCPLQTIALYVYDTFMAKFKNFHCLFDKVVEISEETRCGLLKDFSQMGKRTDSRGSNSYLLELAVSPYTSTEVLREGYCVVNNINHMSVLLETKGISLKI